jgi:exosortase
MSDRPFSPEDDITTRNSTASRPARVGPAPADPLAVITAAPENGSSAPMVANTATAVAPPSRDPRLERLLVALADVKRAPVFWLGVLALVLPTFAEIAVRDWGTDQAAHAPIVLATAIWVFAMHAKEARRVARPPRAVFAALAIVPWLVLYAAATITGLLEIRGLAAYGTMVAVLFALGGAPVLKVLWFPLVYSLFLIPLPDSLVDTVTQPVKIGISGAAVTLLSAFGYPIASSGVTIFVGQYELLVAAACAGLNSLISLTAVGMFYVYLLHRASWRYTLALITIIFPIAVFANFIRVVTLVLLTYHFGEATAQGFLHDAAGIFMFMVALLTIFLIDRTAQAVMGRSGGRRG